MFRTIRRIFPALAETWQNRAIIANPLSTYLFFLRFNSNKARTVQCNFRFGKNNFFARWQDWYTIKEIICNNEYSFLIPICSKYKELFVVDLGANIGLFSLFVFVQFPNAHIIAFEPSLETFAVLRKNQMSNSQYHWEIARYAMWNFDGCVLFENKEYSTSSRIKASLQNSDPYRNKVRDVFTLKNRTSTEAIPITRSGTIEMVQTLCANTLLAQLDRVEEIQVLKCDIEGAEEIFLSTAEALLKKVKNLIVEIHSNFCEYDSVVLLLKKFFPYLQDVKRHSSKKPLLLASKEKIII